MGEQTSKRLRLGPGKDGIESQPTATTMHNMSFPDSPSSSLVPLSPTPISHGVFSIARLTDSPTYDVPAGPWTKVTDDDQLVSHLISLWATWDHLFRDGIILEPFLQDMRSRRLDAKFCSPFLVNCLLAAACPYSDYDEARTRQGKVSSLMDHFIREASEHLQIEEVESSITKAQGLVVLSSVLCRMGRQQDAFDSAIHANIMCEQLQQTHRQYQRIGVSKQEDDMFSYAIKDTCWGVFGMTTAAMLSWARPQPFLLPTCPWPNPADVDAPRSLEEWQPYPKKGREQNPSLGRISLAHAELTMLEREISLIVYQELDGTKEGVMLAKQVALLDLELRLRSWYGLLPMHIWDYSSLSPPSVFILQ